MNTTVVSALIAKLTAGCGLVLLLPLLTALFGEEPVLPFIYSMALCFLLSAFLRYKGKKKVINLNPRDGLAVTALSWICISILYLFPYFLSGLLSPLDALVESISGLTGTGATVFSDLTVLPKSILFFRSLTHWLGGLGIIVIFVALFPQAGKGSARMIDAESTGPYSSRAVPRIKEMAKALFAVYLLFTVSAALIYTLLGMNFFDAVNHAFSTIATGGFSTKNESIAFYDSTPLKLAVIFFMVISSANFGIYVAAWKRGIRVLWENTEFKVYLSIVAAATILIFLNLMLESGLYAPSALLEALFTSASLSSTTGFISYDFETWPHFSQVILLILMFIGGCGGSTSGGLKVTRIILLFKSMTAVLRQKLHPRAVIQTRAGGENFSESMLLEVFCFFFIYTMSIFLWTALIAASGADIPSALGLSIATMSNSGPALGQFGATCNWSAMPAMTKIVVALSMLMGRLESFTLLILFLPSFWRKNGW